MFIILVATSSLFASCWSSGYKLSNSVYSKHFTEQKLNKKTVSTGSFSRNLLGNEKLLPEDRIVGGEDVIGREFPYHVAIVRKNSSFCGGTLINDRWVLTAAHCINNSDTGTYTQMYLGSNKKNIFKKRRWMYYYKVYPKFFQLPKNASYNLKIEVDIALIQMNKKVKFDDDIQPAKLPRCTHGDYANETVILVGFGKSFKQELDLQKGYAEVGTRGYCTLPNKYLTLCTTKSSGASMCYRDSGGPVVLQSTGEFVAVLSQMEKHSCNTSTRATRVSPYLEWIKEVQFYAELPILIHSPIGSNGSSVENSGITKIIANLFVLNIFMQILLMSAFNS